ncbi:type II secretion system protein [Candidatus Kaiserbacteria bacterium]|nr:type II secretion system protein [Candidatus Kaiserbacteria bacterium]
MKLWQQRGMTIIELLVVIAIIGVLAAVILASLNDARQSGVEAKIKTEVDSIAKRAAIDFSTTGTYHTVCGSGGYTQSTIIADYVTSINTMASSSMVCNSADREFAVSVPVDGGNWCADSEGNRRTIASPLTTSPVETICP